MADLLLIARSRAMAVDEAACICILLGKIPVAVDCLKNMDIKPGCRHEQRLYQSILDELHCGLLTEHPGFLIYRGCA